MPFRGFLAEQTYHIGQCALMPDSSALIASHSRKKPYKDGRVGMTLTYIPFNGDKAKELPFVDANADYQHPLVRCEGLYPLFRLQHRRR